MAQLVTSFLWPVEKSIIIRQYFFSLRRKSSDSFFCSGLKVKNTCFCVWILSSVKEEAIVARDEGFIDWDYSWGGLSWHSFAAGALQGSSAFSHYVVSQKVLEPKRQSWQGKSLYSLHSPAELCFCNLSIFPFWSLCLTLEQHIVFTEWFRVVHSMTLSQNHAEVRRADSVTPSL